MILPQLRTPDFDIELFTEDNMVQLLSGPAGKTMGEILKDPSIPVLAFTGTLYREMRYIVEQHKTTELAMFLTIKPLSRTKPHWLAFDLFMPKQRISSATVVMDAPDCERYFEALSEMPYFKEHGLHRNLAHLHSHASFGVFWSATDDTEQFSRDELGFHDDYRIFIVVNAKGDIKCSYVGYKPVLHRVDAATCVLYSCPEYARELTKERKAELDTMATEAMIRNTYQYTYPGFPSTGTGKKTGYARYGWGTSYGTGNYSGGYWDVDTGEYIYADSCRKYPERASTTTASAASSTTYSYTRIFNVFRSGLRHEKDLYGLIPTETEIQEFAEGITGRKVTLSSADRSNIRELLPRLYTQLIKYLADATPDTVGEYAHILGSYINGLLFIVNNPVILRELYEDDLEELGYRLEKRTRIVIGSDMIDILLHTGMPDTDTEYEEFVTCFANDLIIYNDDNRLVCDEGSEMKNGDIAE